MNASFRGARPLDPRKLVRRLADLARVPGRTVASLPHVRIDALGATHSGTILGCEEHEQQGGGQFVLLASREGHGAGGDGGALAYLDLRLPFAITLEEAGAWPAIFRDGAIARWSDDAALNELETSRALDEARERFGQMNIALDVAPELFAAAASAEANNVLRDLILELAAYVEALDAVAKQAITRVEVRRDPASLSASREENTFRVAFDPEDGLPDRADVAAALDLAF